MSLSSGERCTKIFNKRYGSEFQGKGVFRGGEWCIWCKPKEAYEGWLGEGFFFFFPLALLDLRQEMALVLTTKHEHGQLGDLPVSNTYWTLILCRHACQHVLLYPDNFLKKKKSRYHIKKKKDPPHTQWQHRMIDTAMKGKKSTRRSLSHSGTITSCSSFSLPLSLSISDLGT